MSSEYARRAGARYVVHGIVCAGSFLAVAVVACALAAWTTLGGRELLIVIAVGIAACAGYAYFLLKRYRVKCPECEFPRAHFGRDMQNRMLLVCPQCGLRAATGRKVIADSPTGH